jgi:hypothetical protein
MKQSGANMQSFWFFFSKRTLTFANLSGQTLGACHNRRYRLKIATPAAGSRRQWANKPEEATYDYAKS